MDTNETDVFGIISPGLDSSDLEELGIPREENSYEYTGDIANLREPWIREPRFVPTITVYGVTLVLGIIGNSLVIFAMLGDRKSRSVTASFMVSLAAADLLFLVVCVPYGIVHFFTAEWISGPALCKISASVEMLSAMASVLNMMAVSIERYIVIVHPMNARSWCTVENTKKILPLVWIIAFALSSPTLYIWDTENSNFHTNETSLTITLCADVGVSETHRLSFAIYQFLFMFSIPVIVLFFCYAFVIHALWLSSRQLLQMTSHTQSYTDVSSTDESNRQATLTYAFTYEVPSGQSPDVVQRHSHIRSRRTMLTRATREHSAEVFRARKQVIKMLITIIMVFLVCWGPRCLFRIFQRVKFQWIFSKWALNTKIALDFLPFVHSCLNPVIYCFMSKNFRNRMACACRASVCRRTHPNLVVGRRLMAGSDYKMESRSTNGTVHTKISLRHASSSASDT